MAYANLLNQTCVDKKELFCRMRDFLCKRNGTYDYSTTGIGWTLFDFFYAVDEDNPQINDWVVFYSSGENGNQDIYCRIKWTNSLLQFYLYQSWNPTTHTGSANPVSLTTSWAVPESSPNPIWIYGDLDKFAIVYEYSTTYVYLYMVGVTKSAFKGITGDSLTKATALTAGVNVVIDFGTDIPVHWVAGLDVFIRTTHTDDLSTVNMEKTRIITTTSTSITVDLVNNYTAGSKVTDHVGYLGGTNNQTKYCAALIGQNGTLYCTTTAVYNTSFTLTYEDPDSYSDFIGVYPILFPASVGAIGYFDDFCITPNHNTGFTHKDVLVSPGGETWRCFNAYSNFYVALKEV